MSAAQEPPGAHGTAQGAPGTEPPRTAGERAAAAEGLDPESRLGPEGERYLATRPRYGRYAGLLAVVVLIAITINTLNTKPNGVTGVAPGQPLPPFAAPLAQGTLSGDANVATRSGQGAAGSVPACSVRGPQVLNICELYEHHPVVLALFVNGGSCPAVLSDMQSLVGAFPQVRFAAVAIRGSRVPLRTLIRARGLTFPVGIDADGVLAALYKDATCPQVNFAYPGGVVQSRALLNRPAPATLRARVAQLLAATRERGLGAPGP